MLIVNCRPTPSTISSRSCKFVFPPSNIPKITKWNEITQWNTTRNNFWVFWSNRVLRLPQTSNLFHFTPQIFPLCCQTQAKFPCPIPPSTYREQLLIIRKIASSQQFRRERSAQNHLKLETSLQRLAVLAVLAWPFNVFAFSQFKSLKNFVENSRLIVNVHPHFSKKIWETKTAERNDKLKNFVNKIHDTIKLKLWNSTKKALEI